MECARPSIVVVVVLFASYSSRFSCILDFAEKHWLIRASMGVICLYTFFSLLEFPWILRTFDLLIDHQLYHWCNDKFFSFFSILISTNVETWNRFMEQRWCISFTHALAFSFDNQLETNPIHTHHIIITIIVIFSLKYLNRLYVENRMHVAGGSTLKIKIFIEKCVKCLFITFTQINYIQWLRRGAVLFTLSFFLFRKVTLKKCPYKPNPKKTRPIAGVSILFKL